MHSSFDFDIDGNWKATTHPVELRLFLQYFPSHEDITYSTMVIYKELVVRVLFTRHPLFPSPYYI
jgi:hypothetical protein